MSEERLADKLCKHPPPETAKRPLGPCPLMAGHDGEHHTFETAQVSPRKYVVGIYGLEPPRALAHADMRGTAPTDEDALEEAAALLGILNAGRGHLDDAGA